MSVSFDLDFLNFVWSVRNHRRVIRLLTVHNCVRPLSGIIFGMHAGHAHLSDIHYMLS